MNVHDSRVQVSGNESPQDSNTPVKTEGFFQKLLGYGKYFGKHWNEPPPGRHLSFKEFFAYSVGGIGVYGGQTLPFFVTLTYGLYIAAALNFTNDEIMWVGIASSIFVLIRSPLIGMIIDNTNTRYGKFRPYLISMPIPIIILFFAIGWIPPMIGNHLTMVIVFAILFNLQQIFIVIYTTAFTSLVQVISPSPEERTDLMSYGAFIYSLGPSLINIIFPLAANLLFTVWGTNEWGKKIIVVQGINAIGTFRWVLPILAILFFGFGLIAAFFTEERIVVPKKFKHRIGFLEGVRRTLENKYFWILNASTALEALKLIALTFVVWICNYMLAPQMSEAFAASVQSIFTTIMGMACVPGMLLAPWLINRFGKRNLIVYSNMGTIIFTVPMIFFLDYPYLLLASCFLITLFNAVQVVTKPAITSQLYDYQQYKTGDRLEGFLSQFTAIILAIFTIMIAFIQPNVQKYFGYMGEMEGVISPLYSADVINPIIRTMCIIGIISGIICTIPMFFWDLSEKRHNQIMDILKVRANFEDGLCDEKTKIELEARIEAGEKNILAWFENVDKK
ncbi:MAG: MFS transporter [Firmicutes bacterium]|jgi:GPH family glycoside/pentoside/hexuronide:cation symporter/probable glucitol transport protein GutA|nr:MFS transporter [Bacillota bacterium]